MLLLGACRNEWRRGQLEWVASARLASGSSGRPWDVGPVGAFGSGPDWLWVAYGLALGVVVGVALLP